jgi:aldehyde dehydrogenase (NAD+)
MTVTRHPMWIDGEPVETARWMPVYDPATEELVAEVPAGEPAHAHAAVAAARRAFDDGPWPRMSPRQRAEILHRIGSALEEHAEELGHLECRTSGATIRRTLFGDVPMAARYFHDVAELAQTFEWEIEMPPSNSVDANVRRIVREPVGVCVGITPFNGPIALGAWKAGAAIAMGNTVVIKPSPLTPATTVEMARIASDCGLPPGVFNVVVGPGADLGETLVGHRDVDHVAFTGSTSTGRRVMELAASTIKHVILELGGKCPAVILADADLPTALDALTVGAFFHSGQACIASSRILVPRAMEDEVVDGLVERARSLTVGDPMDWSSDLGPLISAAQLERVANHVAGAVSDGAGVACGGGRVRDLPRGHYFEPTVLRDVDNNMRVAREEVFGPVTCVIAYDDEDEAVRIANDTPYGLAAAVWSEDVERAAAMAGRIRSGTVWLNEWLLLSDAPFGGYKQSGLGREGGHHGLSGYTELKHVYRSLARDRASRVWYRIVLPEQRDADVTLTP